MRGRAVVLGDYEIREFAEFLFDRYAPDRAPTDIQIEYSLKDFKAFKRRHYEGSDMHEEIHVQQETVTDK